MIKTSSIHPAVFQPRQSRFIDIPQAPFSYWLRDRFLELLSGLTLDKVSKVCQGLVTADDTRFVRFFWEVSSKIWLKPLDARHWVGFVKGGGYGRWYGQQYWVVDWERNGERIKASSNPRVQNESYYFKEGWTYSYMARGSLGVRQLPKDIIFCDLSAGVFPNRQLPGLSICLNSRLSSFIIRAISPRIQLRESYVQRIPLPKKIPNSFSLVENILVGLKKRLVERDVIEMTFTNWKIGNMTLRSCYFSKIQDSEVIATALHTIEAVCEKLLINAYSLDEEDTAAVMAETGEPSGWFPLIRGYDTIPEVPQGIFNLPEEIMNHFESQKRENLSHDELDTIKLRLKVLYEAGPGSKAEDEKNLESFGDDDKKNFDKGARIPIPADTFIEELSHKLKIHPISIYWLLKEMREKEDLVCPSELKLYAEDYVSVMIIHMLGYQWPKQVEAGEPLPDWADDDGIIPLTDGLGETTLLDRIRKRFGADFREEKEASIESEFYNIVGKSLERWLEEDLFARHVKQFKNRPIAWHIVSDPSVVNHETGQSGKGKRKGGKKKHKPAFSVMIHYHRFVDGDKGYGKLLRLKNKYLEKLMSQTRSELESLRGRGDDPKTFDRIAELDRKLVELEDFRERLERIQEGKDPESSIFVRWKSTEEQPQGWRPDINDGVKINIAPWERLGMFPVKKIVGEVERAPV